MYVTRKSKLRWFNDQKFSVRKAENEFRIFCFGGSVTFGRPYTALTAFPNWLQLNLQALDSTKHYKVINVGGVSYASYRIVNLMKEMVRYQPDVFIVYSGNNEFLENITYSNIKNEPRLITDIRIQLNKLRIYSLMRSGWLSLKQKKNNKTIQRESQISSEVNAMLDQSFGLNRYHRDVKRKKAVLNYFQFNLDEMINIAKRHGIEIIFIVPPSNEKDFSPFKSEYCQNLNSAQLIKFENNYKAGLSNLDSMRYKVAFEKLRAAEKVDSCYADLLYRKGQCLFRMKKYEEAKIVFAKAQEFDVAPLRATNKIRQIIRQIGKKYKIPTLDLARILRQKNHQEHGYPILGKETFLDHVHPTIKTNQFIANELTKMMLNYKIIEPEKNWEEINHQQLYESVIEQIDSSYFAMRDLNLAKVLDWSGKTDESAAFIKRAAKSLPNNPEAQYALGLLYQRQKNNEKAAQIYRKVLKLDSTFADAYNALGRIYETNNNLDEALIFFQMAIKYKPQFDEAYYNFGDTIYKKGDLQKAIGAYKKVLQINPYHIQALNDLGATFMEINNFNEAINAFESLLQIEPKYYRAYNNLGLIYFRQNNLDKSRAMFVKALGIKPDDKFSLYWLKQVEGKLAL
ncbi:tetratricopeptide repeat protein [candidate division KSB1 bacterium]|nr:tetratricopeptide repeat protein [candidate division KSB1 bacterium]